MGESSDGDVIAESLTDPTVFGVVFDRVPRAMLRFLVRRVGLDVGEDLVAELFKASPSSVERL